MSAWRWAKVRFCGLLATTAFAGLFDVDARVEFDLRAMTVLPVPVACTGHPLAADGHLFRFEAERLLNGC